MGVARRGRDSLGGVLDLPTVDLLDAAGVLHDIGYASPLVDSGFHPLDGARYLRSIGFDDRVVNLVAHHSCARVEAELRGLGYVLATDFPIDRSLPHDELCFCDMTTDPDGGLVSVEKRLLEIRGRYQPGSVVLDFVEAASEYLTSTVRRVEHRISQRQPSGSLQAD